MRVYDLNNRNSINEFNILEKDYDEIWEHSHFKLVDLVEDDLHCLGIPTTEVQIV